MCIYQGVAKKKKGLVAHVRWSEQDEVLEFQVPTPDKSVNEEVKVNLYKSRACVCLCLCPTYVWFYDIFIYTSIHVSCTYTHISMIYMYVPLWYCRMFL